MESKATCQFVADNEEWVCTVCGSHYQATTGKPPRRFCGRRSVAKQPQVAARMAEQPGHILHHLIARFTGEGVTPTCECKSRIRQMNEWGAGGCREHLTEIVDWLEEEAVKRGWRLAKWKTGRLGIKMMVLYAIRKAERDQRR